MAEHKISESKTPEEKVIKNSNNLNTIIEMCKEFKDKKFVFKLCNDNITKRGRELFVVMEKLSDTSSRGIFESRATPTKTNEARSDVIDKRFAKFRGNKFRVVRIIDKIDPSSSKEIKVINSEYYDLTKSEPVVTRYEVGEIVESAHYEEDNDTVRAAGIHYFTTIKAAFYYSMPSNYSGFWSTYNDNGRKESEGNVVNGRKEGVWLLWTLPEAKYKYVKYENDEFVSSISGYFDLAINTGTDDEETEVSDDNLKQKKSYFSTIAIVSISAMIVGLRCAPRIC